MVTYFVYARKKMSGSTGSFADSFKFWVYFLVSCASLDRLTYESAFVAISKVSGEYRMLYFLESSKHLARFSF